MKEITGDNAIFLSADFQNDKYKFNLILKNLSSPNLELYSDEENYVFCRGNKEWPTWIWTKDNFDKNKVNEIEQTINIYLTDAESDKFICKKDLYELLKNNGFNRLNLEDYFEMGFLMCKKTKRPKFCDATISVPNKEDKNILIKYWYDDNIEMSGENSITMKKAEEDIEKFFKTGNFYILRNKENKIVCMGSYTLTEEQAKISHVYTPVEERNKGYAANLIYAMTNDLLENGFVPLLYTDYNYIPSNKAYINAGYEDEGILIKFSCSKQKEIV